MVIYQNIKKYISLIALRFCKPCLDLFKVTIILQSKAYDPSFRIQQVYLQHENYAIWEVIKFGDSDKAPPEKTAKDKELAGEVSSSTKKKGKTVAITAEDMQKRKNDVKARTTLFLALSDEHQLKFSKYDSAKELCSIVWRNIDDLDTMSLDDVYNHLKVYEPEVQKRSGSNSQNIAFISSSNISSGKRVKTEGRGRESYKKDPKVEEPAPKAMIAIDEVPTEYALMVKSSSRLDNEVYDDSFCSKSCWKNTKNLNTKISKLNEELSDCETDLYNYKRGLSQVEARLVEFKENEIKYCEKIRVLERDIELKDNKIEHLRNELEEVKKEKESVDFKIENFKNASKDLDRLLGSQKLDKDMKDVGFNKPTPSIDVSKEQEERWKSKTPSFFEQVGSSDNVVSKPMIKFVKESGCPSATKVNNTENTRKPTVKYAEMYRNSSQSPRMDKEKTWTRVNHAQDNMKYTSTHKSMTSRAVLLKSGTKPINRPFSTARPTLKSAEPKMTSFVKTTHSNVKRPFERKSAGKNKVWSATVRLKIPTVGSKVPIAKPIVAADKGNKGKAVKASAHFKLVDDKHVLLRTPRQQNMYTTGLKNIVPHKNLTCLIDNALVDERKQHKASCKSKLVNSVSKPLHTLHMDLFGPTSVSSLNHKWYCLVVTDDFSRFTWTFFLKSMDETSRILRNFITEIENLKDLNVKIIRSDNGGEFRNKEMDKLCSRKGIKREFSNARTLQQNGVAERRNRTLIEAARTMVLVIKPHNKTLYELFNERSHAIGFLRPFGCHVMILNTLDHLGKFDAKGDEGYFVGYSLSSKAFRVFNKRTKKIEENLHVNFLENKSIEKGTGPDWLFDIDTLTNSMNYVPVSVAGTSSTNISGTKEDVHQAVKEKEYLLRFIALQNWFHKAQMATSNETAKNDDVIPINNAPQQEQQEFNRDKEVPESSENLNPTDITSSVPRIISKRGSSFPEPLSLGNAMSFENRLEDFFGDTSNAVSLNEVEADLSNMETAIQVNPTLTLRIHKDHPKSQIIGPVDTPVQTKQKTKNVDEQSFIAIIHQKTNSDLLQVRPIRTKWVLKNKKDKRGIVIKNKARLVAQGHTQEERINYEEVFAYVTRIEAIRLFLAYASYMGFIVYQMDVKSAFPFGTIDEEVYVMQPPGFQDLEFPHRVYKVEKAMYGLHQAPRAWYGTLSKYLLDNGFQRGTIDQTLFIRKLKGEFLLVQVSMVGSLMYLTASRPDIMFDVCACARYQVIPKECHLHAVKRIFRYLKGNPKLGLWYPKEYPFDLVEYSDSDYGGGNQDRKSTTKGCQFLGRRLISLQCKKQTIVATSTTESPTVPTHLINFNPASYTINLSMEKLAFCDYHNMVSILEKTEYYTDFHQIVDFLEASHIRVETMHGETKILAQVNGRQRTISESSIRRHLKINDKEATNRTYNFFNMIFDGMMRNVKSKGKFLIYLRTVELFASMLVLQGEGSEHPTELHHTPSDQDEPIHHEPITQSPQHAQITSHEPIPQSHKQTTSQEPTIPSQSHSVITTPSRITRGYEEVFPTDTSLDTSQDRENIAKTSAMPHEALPRVTSLGGGEGRGCSKHEGVDQGEDLLDGNTIKDSDKSAGKESDSTDEMANVLGPLGAKNILASEGLRSVFITASLSVATISTYVSPAVATASGSFPAAVIFTTASVATPTTRVTRSLRGVVIGSSSPISANIPSISKKDKGKKKMTKPKQPNLIIREQAKRDFEIARIHAEKELEMMIAELDRSNEMVTKHLAQIKKYQAQQNKPATKTERRNFYMSILRSNASWKARDFKGMTFKQIEEKSIPVWERMKDFMPMNSKLESKRLKRLGI
nr:hypothetical protein [Tanacetum cinerariifolium]